VKIMKPVEVSAHGFAFCRWGITLLVWLALVPGFSKVLWVVTVILSLSALLKVRNAPMIWLHRVTVGRFISSPTIVLDEYAMAFAHSLGANMSLACCLAWIFAPHPIALGATLLLCIAKTAGALGHCSGVKLYQCMQSETCCRFMKAPHA